MPPLPRAAAQVLRRLYRSPASPWELIDSQDGTLREFCQVLERLEAEGLISRRGTRFELTEAGRREAARLGGGLPEFRCGACGGRGYALPELEFADEFLRMVRGRPLPLEEYDQGYIAPEDVLLRAGFMLERGDVAGRSILLIGDDDLLSIALALTGVAKRVHALDADSRVVEFINSAASELDAELEAEVYDVRKPLPEELAGEFDVFVTDPVETLPGITLFLSRGAEGLRGRGCSGYFGLTTLEAGVGKWYRIQGVLQEMGFAITDIRRRFSVYPCEESNFFRYQEKLRVVKVLGSRCDHHWFRSAFCRVEAAEEPAPAVRGEVELGEEMYHDEECWATPE